MRQYFVEGTLPKEGTVCQSESRPFDSAKNGLFEPPPPPPRADEQGRLLLDYMEEDDHDRMSMSEEDKLLLNAMQELSSRGSPFMTTTIF